MIRTMDYGGGRVARALLSDRYRRIDNMEIASAVLPLFAGSDQYEVISSEVTENRMYLKILSRRLEMEVVPGDYVQAGVVISNSEVGLGSVNVQPLVVPFGLHQRYDRKRHGRAQEPRGTRGQSGGGQLPHLLG